MRNASSALVLLLSGLLLVLLTPWGAARADQPYRWTPLGFCSLSGMSSATLASSCMFTNTLNGVAATWATAGANATYAQICAYTQGVNYRDDGVAPTATTGTGGQSILAGGCVQYYSTMSALQFIQLSPGAVLGISFYR